MEKLCLLIADEDNAWSSEAKKYFVNLDYDVKEAVNGKDAQLAAYNNKLFAVVLNFSIKNHSSVQVLKYIKLNYTGVKVIIVLNQESLLAENSITVDDLISLGASEVILKTSDWEKLRGVVESYQSMLQIIGHSKIRDTASEEVEMEAKDDAFTSVKVDEFYSGQAVLFDVYVKLASGRYVKILHAGDTFEQARIDKYKAKGTTHLYFSNHDRIRYIRLSNFIATKMLKSKSVNTETKMNLTKNIIQKFAEEMYTKDFNPQAIMQASEVTQNVFNLIENEADLYKFLKEQMETDPTQFSHVYLVGLYCCLVCKQFEWDSAVTRETLAMAAMLHDIGKSKLPKDLQNKFQSQMTASELEDFSQHPIWGAEIVSTNKKINPTVAQIILQHHELCDGTGIPHGLKRGRISTLGRVVCFINAFVNYIMENKINPVDGLKTFLKFPGVLEKYDGVVIEKFCQCFINPIKLEHLKTHVG